MIELINVTKEYDNGTLALENVNLQIENGEFVFLVGSSGAGKTTITKLLMREENVTSGEIFLNGEDITKITEKEIPYLRRKMGVVFQDFRLLNDRTVYENVEFAMRVVGASKREIRRRVPVVLNMVGLNYKAKMLPMELSGGEQQRVGIARAIVNGPSLLIADEPTGNLDPQTSLEIMEILDKINSRGITVLISTHDHAMVNHFRKRVITLESGEIIKDVQAGTYG